MNEQPEKQEGGEKLILEAKLMPNGQVAIRVQNFDFSLLSFVIRLLNIELDQRIIKEHIRSKAESSGCIIKPGNNGRNGLMKFLRGR